MLFVLGLGALGANCVRGVVIFGVWVAKVPGAMGTIRSIKHSGLKQVLGSQMTERWLQDDAEMTRRWLSLGLR